MQLTINIDDNLLDTLNTLASENSLTPEEYAGNIVQSFLEGQYRGKLIENIQNTPLSDLSSAEIALNKFNPLKIIN